MNKWSKQSKENYRTLHPDLKLLADEVLKIHDCTIRQGYRDERTQNRYFKKGTSKVKYPDSKHNKMPSEAIDLSPYIPNVNPWDMEHVLHFAGIVQAIASQLYTEGSMSKKLIWGGSWGHNLDAPLAFDEDKFFDGIHFSLED